MDHKTIKTAEQQLAEERYYTDISGANLAPLWVKLHNLVPRTPTSAAQPFLWDYDGELRGHLMRAGEVVSAEEAERRVLILENPGMRGQASITPSLYAGLQLVLPGEMAPQHRHSQSALRFAIEGQGAYTTVNGERVAMYPGDFVLTPSGRWHDHGNETDKPMVWLDGLDIPIVSFFGAGFAEPGDQAAQASTIPAGDNSVRYGNNLLPVDWRPSDRASPILRYPYERSRETLDQMTRADAPDACHGHKLRFINPASGEAPLPTIGAFIQAFPQGFASSPYRSTDGTVFSVIEGEGESLIGTTRLSWKARDIFVVPPWQTVTHTCSQEAVLFSFSDRPSQTVLGLWREDRVPDTNVNILSQSIVSQ